ncbi:hypothetical protein [Amycolatopsis nigrescens]|uniref:hypothetical protein n=1 Tax=Amycolatopsis nigrescens TaxID=381445 RepID=UPI000365980F|nr:hypothetical protein [Amycolatopsis nigrescens]
MTPLAVALAALGACGYAVGARLQHRAVRETIGDRGMKTRSLLLLVRNTRWLLGLLAVGSGAVVHACALGMAPLSVVQPVGVLALPITVLLTTREQGIRVRDMKPSVAFAVLAAAGGVVAFVLLAAGSATPTPVTGEELLLATWLIGGAVLVLAIVGVMTRSRFRCLMFAGGCAVAYGYVSLLMRAVAQEFGNSGIAGLEVLPLLGIAVAMLVGGCLLQYGYASGPPDLVVACLTVVDPIVAVGLGIGLLGEAARVGPWTAVGEAVCAVVACAGVFALARYHPDTRKADTPEEEVPPTPAGSGAFAGSTSTDHSDRSSS